MLWVNRRNKRRGRSKLVIYCVGILLIVFGLGLFAAFRLNKSQLVSPVPSQRVILGSIEERKDKKQEAERLLQAANIAFLTVIASKSSSIAIKLDNDAEVLLSKDKNVSEQVSSLQGILSRLTMEGKKFVLLDLRFSKPIIQLE